MNSLLTILNRSKKRRAKTFPARIDTEPEAYTCQLKSVTITRYFIGSATHQAVLWEDVEIQLPAWRLIHSARLGQRFDPARIPVEHRSATDHLPGQIGIFPLYHFGCKQRVRWADTHGSGLAGIVDPAAVVR